MILKNLPSFQISWTWSDVDHLFKVIVLSEIAYGQLNKLTSVFDASVFLLVINAWRHEIVRAAVEPLLLLLLLL